MALSITVNGGGTFSASMEEGPVSFTATLGAVPGPKGDTGATGPAGVVASVLPIYYDPGTQTVSIDPDPTFTSVTATTLTTTNLAFADATTQTTAFLGEARKEYIVARNNTGSTIAKGKVVYLNGATGNKPTMALAQADAEATSARTIGILVEETANNGDGKVIISGAAENIDTSAFTAGQVVYLSSSVAGGLQTTLPTQPNHGVVVGIVTRSSPSVGSIEVTIQNYQELHELSDVLIASKANNDLLAWDAASSVWKNKTFSTLGLLTSADAASTYQTQAGMSAYLTTSTAASTYAPIASPTFTGTVTIPAGASISGFLTTATAASTYAPLASPTFTGTVTIPAGASISGYLTTSSAASTYAPLASPALTGNPTAPTPATNDNDTSIATTAFVNAYAPAASTTVAGKVQLATDTEAIAASSSTLAITARTAKLATMEEVWSPSGTDMTAATSGLGANAGSTISALSIRLVAPNSATAGYATRGFPLWYTSTAANTNFTYDGVQAIGGVVVNPNTGSWTATNNAVLRGILGRRLSTIAIPTYAVSEKSFGFEVEFKTGGPELRVFAHNGTSLSTAVASFTITNLRPFTILAVKDGSTVRLYVNGSEVASTTGAPTGNESGIGWGQFEIVTESTTTAGNMPIQISNPKVIHPVV